MRIYKIILKILNLKRQSLMKHCKVLHLFIVFILMLLFRETVTNLIEEYKSMEQPNYLDTASGL